ncbi:UBA/TS-N domain-containing protein [Cryptosporidium serpentis]
MKQRVQLHIYDISNGMAAQLSPVLLGRSIEGIYHTGVLVYNFEYFYGGGIVCVKPEEISRLYGLHPIRTLCLGTTDKSQQELNDYLKSISNKFSSEKYDLINHNCNHFSDSVVRYLVGEGIPSYILDLPNEVMKTPFGSMILPMLQKAQKSQMIRSVTNIWNNTNLSSSSITNGSEETGVILKGNTNKFYECLTRIVESQGQACKNALETLETILLNILSYPNEPRYRSIKSTSNVLRNSLLNIEGGLRLLELIGFHEVTINNQTKYEINLSYPIEDFEKARLGSFIQTVKYALNSLHTSGEEDKFPHNKALEDKLEINYIEKLNEIKSMGFTDSQKILKSLYRAKGDLSLAISYLIEDNL